MSKKLTEQEIIIRAIKQHGLCRYGYDKINYISYHTKINIKCFKCNKYFIQSPAKHLKGNGCPICAIKQNAKKQSLNSSTFIKKAKLIHNNSFDYSNVNYINAKTKVQIWCKKCKKYFWQTPDSHTRKKRPEGCPTCVGKNLNINDIISRFIEVHCWKYNYAKINITNSKTKIQILCLTCFNYFWQSPDNHYRGRGCPTCKSNNFTGKNHPNWKGGKSIESYCPVWFDKKYKLDIKNRDNNICRNPYCFHTTKKLSIHHIDYDKKNCHPSNLITLCVSCNSRANKDRKWHQEWYQILMNKKLR